METDSSEHNDTADISLWGASFPSPPGWQLDGLPPAAQTHLKDLSGMFFMVALNVLALLANTAVLVVIIKAPHLKKFAFVCHLCAVDLLCAVLLMPLGVVSSSPYFAGVEFTALECQVYVFLNVVLVAASIFTITVISVERYYYIVHPMRYEVKMTLKLAVAVIAAVWVASALLGLATVFVWPTYGSLRTSISAAHCSLHWSHDEHRRGFAVLFCLACFCVPAAVIFAVYCNVYKVARIAARQHVPQPSWTTSYPKRRSDSINSQTTIITTTRNAPRRALREKTAGGRKAALTLLLIVGQFLLCWLPYFAYHLHLTLSGSPRTADVKEAVTWLAYSSFAANPFFYGLLNRQIREELCKLRRCYSGRPVELAASSHDGSVHDNFLQFLQRTSCTVETRASLAASSSPRNTLDQTSCRIPGQIPEEFS